MEATHLSAALGWRGAAPKTRSGRRTEAKANWCCVSCDESAERRVVAFCGAREPGGDADAAPLWEGLAAAMGCAEEALASRVVVFTSEECVGGGGADARVVKLPSDVVVGDGATEAVVRASELLEGGASELHTEMARLGVPFYLWWSTERARWVKWLSLSEYEECVNVPLLEAEAAGLKKAVQGAAVYRCGTLIDPEDVSGGGDVAKDDGDVRSDRKRSSALDVSWQHGASQATVRAAAWVGVLSTATVVAQLRPKFELQASLMVTYCHLPPGARIDDGHRPPVARAPMLSFLLASPFAAAMEKLRDAGLMQGFKRIREDSRMVRGQLDTARLHRARGMLTPLPIRRSTVVRDVPHNRLLKAALRRLVRGFSACLDADTTARLRALLRLFTGVGDLPRVGTEAGARAAAESVPRGAVTQLHRHYVAPLRLARAILRASSPMEGVSGLDDDVFPSFLLNMPILFEDFCREGLRRRFAREGRDDGDRGVLGAVAGDDPAFDDDVRVGVRCSGDACPCRATYGVDCRVERPGITFNMFSSGKAMHNRSRALKHKPDLILSRAPLSGVGRRDVVCVGDMKYMDAPNAHSGHQVQGYRTRFKLSEAVIICVEGSEAARSATGVHVVVDSFQASDKVDGDGYALCSSAEEYVEDDEPGQVSARPNAGGVRIVHLGLTTTLAQRAEAEAVALTAGGAGGAGCAGSGSESDVDGDLDVARDDARAASDARTLHGHFRAMMASLDTLEHVVRVMCGTHIEASQPS